MSMLFVWFFACTSDSSFDTAENGTPDLPIVDIPTLRPVWDIVQFQAAVDDALRDGFPRFDEGIGAYLEIFEHGDENCPGGTDFVAIENLNGCTSESGFYFSGTSSYSESETEERSTGWCRFGR